jgi:pimeloyl-ACP methyl ester carboxylesterase
MKGEGTPAPPTTERLSRWRSDAARDAFWARAEALARERLAQPPEAVDVPTRWGPTRAYRWAGAGTAAGDAVVFLHGTGGTGLTWADYADRLGGRTVVALDTLGDVGHTRQERPVHGPDDLAAWLAEALDGLGLARAHLAGTSYGGFLALTLAAREPGRARSLTLVEPGGLAPLLLGRFLLWGGQAMAASLLPAGPRRAAARRLRMPAVDDPELMALLWRSQRDHRARLVPPEPLDDDTLRAIDVPALVLVGDRKQAFDPRAAADRASALLPRVRVEVVPGAGHALALSHADLVVDRMLALLGG